MAELRRLSPRELEMLLGRAREARCPASLRVEGTARMLGHLQVCGLEPGAAILLSGAKQRDLLPPAGTAVALSLVLDEEVVSMGTVLLDAGVDDPARQRPRVLRAAWPTEAIGFHHRDEVRVATPEHPALEATLRYQGRSHAAQLLNLTETGMGLGLEDGSEIPVQAEVVVETLLPGGLPLSLGGIVRHWERLEGGWMALPVRVGLVLKELPPGDRESLRRMVQARRILRSEAIRDE